MGSGRMESFLWLVVLVFSWVELIRGNVAAHGHALDNYNIGPGNFTGKLQLPKFAVPARYDLRLKPDLENLTFTGSVNIELGILSETKFLVYNAVELTILLGDISFSTSDKVFRPVASWQFGEEDQIMILEFEEYLPKGPGVLSILNFKGTLNDQLRGFYRSYYEVNGTRKNMAVTQFEPLDARRCFPCWDEPALKATFKVTLDIPAELMALSNMPVIDEKIDGDFKTVSYQESPIMSTYLVAIVVGIFDYVEDYTSDGARVRVYCPIGRSDEGIYPLDVAVKSLELYKKFFSIPYALPKLDLIGIPDFAAGAMENWGLVTFKPYLLYVKPELAPQQLAASVIAHELGHQWTGDLVTMEWWTHLWLNEGFATWLSAYAQSRMYPEWHTWTSFAQGNADTLRIDANPNSHPIEIPIHNTSDIAGTFDTITYDKGAAVLRMLQTYLRPRVFQRSVAAYVKTFSWSNANTEDLWAVLAKVSGEPVRHVMSSWTKQAGFPLISAKLNHQKLKLQQTQFLSSGAHGNGRWTVPITLCCGSYQTCHSFLLNQKSESFDLKKLPGCSCAKETMEDVEVCPWIKINVNQTGFYRVKYGEDLAARLTDAIKKKYLTTSDRFGVLDDLKAVGVAYQTPLTSMLIFMDAFAEDQDVFELFSLLEISESIVKIAADATPQLLGCIKKIFIGFYEKSAEKLGWDPKPNDILYEGLRNKLLTALAVLGNKATIEEGARRFHLYLNDRNTSLFDPQIRQAAYFAVMQTVSSSNRADFESLISLYKELNDTSDKFAITRSLASCPDPQIVSEALNFLASPKVRPYEPIDGLDAISWEGRESGWIWLRDNWDSLLHTFDTNIGLVISKIVSPFSSEAKAIEIKDFFATRLKGEFASALDESIQQVARNSRWVHNIQQEKHLGKIVMELSHGNC